MFISCFFSFFIKIDLYNTVFRKVVYYIMAEFISIGSDCSTAYQLNKYGLRTAAYPFDHVRIKKLSTICDIINKQFAGYVDFEVKSKKNCYQYTSDIITDIKSTNKTIILKNEYGVIFPHDCSHTEQIPSIIEKYRRRIDRFMSLAHKDIIFIWYEPIKIKMTDIDSFISIINRINPKLVWILVIICRDIPMNSYKNVKFIIDDKEYIDWTRSNLDWSNIFFEANKFKEVVVTEK